MTTRIYEVADGGLDYPRESLLPVDAAPELTAQYAPVIAVPYRPVLINADGAVILLDTGAGPLGPATGKLQASLRGIGVAAEEVDVVVLSHAHADHIGGLLDEAGRPAFPNARLVIGRKEYDFWRRSGIHERLGSGSVYGNPVIESVIGQWFEKYLVRLEDQLDFIEGETELLPGITVVPAAGHTPGQMAVLIKTSDEPLLYTADAFSLAEHVANPEWISSFDLDPHQTVETRRTLLDRAATDNYRVIHYHVGGIGRVVRRGIGYAWEPEQVPQTAAREPVQVASR